MPNSFGRRPPRLSIVIPALGSIASLEAGLVSVLEHRPSDCEVIIVLREPYDDPYELEGEVRFIEAPLGTRASACLNIGVAASRGTIIHLLGCGFEVSDGWTDAALAHFDDEQVVAVAPLVMQPGVTDERVAAAGLEYRAGGTGHPRHADQSLSSIDGEPKTLLGPLASAAFYRSTALDALETVFDAAVGDKFCDIDLALRLRKAGGRAIFEPASRIRGDVAATDPSSNFRSGLHAERLFWRHAGHVGWLRSLALHGLTVAGDLRSPARLVGRLAACCELPLHLLRSRAKPVAAPLTQEAEPSVLPSSLRIDRAHPALKQSNSSAASRSALRRSA
jgi:hypothetical protein